MSDSHGYSKGGSSNRHIERGQVKQSFSNRRTRTVQVERKRRRAPLETTGSTKPEASVARDSRLEILERARQAEAQGKTGYVPQGVNLASARSEAEQRRQRQAEELRKPETPEEAKSPQHSETLLKPESPQRSEHPLPSPQPAAAPSAATAAATTTTTKPKPATAKPSKAAKSPITRETGKRATAAKNTLKKSKPMLEDKRRGKLTIRDALDEIDLEVEKQRGRSIAALKRAREKQRVQAKEMLKTNVKVRREVTVPETLTVSGLANRMAERLGDVVRVLVRLGVTATANENLDADTAELVATEFGHKVKRVSDIDIEARLSPVENEDREKSPCPPVVTVMGHVDHGKTSLLDALRGSHVAKSEAGGITQHIGASRISLPDGGTITFIDTPGHEAFSAMRARGATATDIVVLIVAADDGVKAQTLEAIAHARAAEVPIVVGVSKCDLPKADSQRVYQALAQHGVLVEALQGDTLAAEFSAKTGEGIDKLLEAIVLQAEVLDLKAYAEGASSGLVIESRVEKGHGVLATLIVKEGLLRKGDILLAGAQWGRVRVMLDARGIECREAGPSQPVQVSGLQGQVTAGDSFRTVENEALAREVGENRARLLREKRNVRRRQSVEQMFARAKQEEEIVRFPLVVKADAQGTLEVAMQALQAMQMEKTEILLLHGDVGSITESDVALAAASQGQVIGFNAKPTGHARVQAKTLGVEIRFYSVLYEMLDDMQRQIERELAPKTREIRLGLAEVKEVFAIGKVGSIAGCAVLEGVVRRSARARVIRYLSQGQDRVHPHKEEEQSEVLYEGRIKQVKHFKEEVREVAKGSECGIALESFEGFQPDDRIECYGIETLDKDTATAKTSP